MTAELPLKYKTIKRKQSIGRFPFYKQADAKDCGPTCLKIIAKYYGKTLNIQRLRILSETNRMGSNLKSLGLAAEKIGFRAMAVKIDYNKLMEASLPCILHWNNNHFVVLHKVKNDICYVSDPAFGLITYTREEFLQTWIGSNADVNTREGIVLLVEVTPNFYSDDTNDQAHTFGFSYISKYLLKYKPFLVQLVIGLFAASVLQLIFPFLTQSIVDVGISNKDIGFIFLILLAQLFLFIGRTSIEVIRGWILLHLSTRINISLISDFFIKLMKLPISFFDVRMTGDILQRINDHKRIEKILTTSSLNVLFSTINLLTFGLVLAWYSITIFLIFLTGTVLYFAWVLFFFKKRKILDYKKFSQVSEEQSKVIELINGMQEIKLHNAEQQKRWSWEFLQAKLFKLSVEGLALDQYQNVGSSFINELKNILITIVAAMFVINGQITLGMMLAITYIVGQLNAPIMQIINFLRELQDAKISLERLGEIHHREDEEQLNENKIKVMPRDQDITIQGLTFRYPGTHRPVLENLDITIPANNITAIVGASGSGKTTLMKLLLKFYEPNKGRITLGNIDMQGISQSTWREHCGVVMQEGYIFNDTIAENVCVGVDEINMDELYNATEIANIKSFVEELPLSYNTKIGMEGVGLSTGQKQRILIARAVYKDPPFLFFDEATSALDANNEKTIMGNLDQFFENRTVVVIAHRLSTVKNAHQIIVLDEGKAVEVGNHAELVEKKGKYYELVKNQLELGN